MSFMMQAVPSATLLLTGLSGSGKTTFAAALARRLAERGIHNVALIDEQALSGVSPREPGRSLAADDGSTT
jgi:adenylylsulfate kinase-like enzyme